MLHTERSCVRFWSWWNQINATNRQHPSSYQYHIISYFQDLLPSCINWLLFLRYSRTSLNGLIITALQHFRHNTGELSDKMNNITIRKFLYSHVKAINQSILTAFYCTVADLGLPQAESQACDAWIIHGKGGNVSRHVLTSESTDLGCPSHDSRRDCPLSVQDEGKGDWLLWDLKSLLLRAYPPLSLSLPLSVSRQGFQSVGNLKVVRIK